MREQRAPDDRRSADLDRSTARGAKDIFLRFVMVAIGLNMLAGAAMLVYDVFDTTATTADTLERLGKVSTTVAVRLRAESPGRPDSWAVAEASRLTSMPMALLSPDGKVEFATDPGIPALIPSFFGNDFTARTRVRVEQELGPLSGAWTIRDFTPEHHLLVVVPHMPADEGRMLYVTISGGVLVLGLGLTFLIMLGAANWMLRRPLSGLVHQLTGELAHDVQRRKQAEQRAVAAREDAEEHLGFRDNLLNAAGQLGIVATSADGTIRIFNRAAKSILGYSAEETVGTMTMDQLWSNLRREPLQQVPLRSLMQLHEGEQLIVDSSGRERLVALTTSDIVDTEGRNKGQLLLFLDITERKRLEVELQLNELQLMQSAKLASLGEMATGVAHELNQPLNNIALLASRIKRRLSPADTDEKLLEKLDRIQEQVQRAGKIIQQMRTFGQPKARRLAPVSVSRVVHNVLDLLGHQFKKASIQVHVDLPARLPEVVADESQLEQVITNLLLNARDALSEAPGNEGPGAVRIHADASDDAVRLHVSDNGPGISRDIIDRIFEPFFTTKEVGKGTGLGLPISYSLVRGFGGSITVDSRPGHTTFTVQLKPNDSNLNMFQHESDLSNSAHR